MKRLILSLFLLVGLSAIAGQQVIIGSLVAVNGTTNSQSISIGSVSIPHGSFYIQNGGLTETNALLANVQVSLDNSNFLTVATYRPSSTNATTDFFAPNYSPATIYLRVQAVTTNAVNLGGTYQN